MPAEPGANSIATSTFELDPWVDAGKLAPIFARTGRMHISPASRYSITGWLRAR